MQTFISAVQPKTPKSEHWLEIECPPSYTLGYPGRAFVHRKKNILSQTGTLPSALNWLGLKKRFVFFELRSFNVL